MLKMTGPFFLYVGNEELSPGNVFFEVLDEHLAKDLCNLFEEAYGAQLWGKFNYSVVGDDALSKKVRLWESLNSFAMYIDPDPGIYDPRASRDWIRRAQFAERAQIWAELLESRNPHLGVAQNAGVSQAPAADTAVSGEANATKAAELETVSLVDGLGSHQSTTKNVPVKAADARESEMLVADDPPADLLHEVTRQQRHIVAYLWNAKHATNWRSLPDVCWRNGSTSDQHERAIESALERLRDKLNTLPRFGLSLEVHSDSETTKLNRNSPRK
jgi:hypothetical protein